MQVLGHGSIVISMAVLWHCSEARGFPVEAPCLLSFGSSCIPAMCMLVYKWGISGFVFVDAAACMLCAMLAVHKTTGLAYCEAFCAWLASSAFAAGNRSPFLLLPASSAACHRGQHFTHRVLTSTFVGRCWHGAAMAYRQVQGLVVCPRCRGCTVHSSRHVPGVACTGYRVCAVGAGG
jgi:hypothetical protein